LLDFREQLENANTDISQKIKEHFDITIEETRNVITFIQSTVYTNPWNWRPVTLWMEELISGVL
jgi:hypothetical protein